MAKSQIILVTGSNRGIGFSIVQATAFRNPSFTYILACRSASSGKTAIAELKKLGVTATLDVVELDVTKDSTIISAKEYVEKKYGRLDGSVPLSPGFHVHVEYLLMLDQCS
jgi:NAD(P)-dependent dehydrogenase (short-subunit alcohol dehydrogenase family)